jgi:hypothetical protein
MTMKVTTAFVLLAASAFASAPPAAAKPFSDEEFVGPFPSWRDVKRDYGAKGDGRADDTAALQRGLDDLQKHKNGNVLYLPPGTYRITDTLFTRREQHTDCMGVSVVGADPATTRIVWDGKPGGILFKYDAWYSRISRLTLDGRHKAATALVYGDHFSTYNETSDMVFQDVERGLLLGVGQGQAENAVLRCTFLRCSDAGIRTASFNSMDIWVWHCRFEDCAYGLFNGAGNFHAYQSLFLRSKKADIGTANLMVFSFVGNTSIGSACFMDFAGGHSWGSPTSVTGNRILEPTGDWAIRLGNGGPFFVADNVIKSRAGKAGPVVGLTWGDNFLVGNRYTVADPVKELGRARRLDERIVDAASIDAAPPRLPPTPPRRARPIFEVAPGADGKAIQAAIALAARQARKRPVVHLPAGKYAVGETLVIPAGLELTIVGDGAAQTATVLEWSGAGGGPLLRLAGPSRATLRDFALVAPHASGIAVEKCDAAGARIVTDQLNLGGINDGEPATAGVRVASVEQADVLLRNLQGGSYAEKWVDVVGGPLAESGQRAPGRIAVLAGASSTPGIAYDVSKGGRLVVRSVYHEMSAPAPQAIVLSDRGTLAVDATRFSYKTAPDRPLVALDGFRGTLSLTACMFLPVASTVTASIGIAGDGSQTHVLAAADLFWVHEPGVDADTVWHNRADPAAHGALLLSNTNSGLKNAPSGGFKVLADRGEASDELLRATLAAVREPMPATGAKPGANVTDLQMHRILVTAGKGGTALTLQR